MWGRDDQVERVLCIVDHGNLEMFQVVDPSSNEIGDLRLQAGRV